MPPFNTLTGHDAINYAGLHGLTLCKYADPTEDARAGLTVDEARAIADEDPGLIYVERNALAEDRSAFYRHLKAYHAHGGAGRLTAAEKEYTAARLIHGRLARAAWQPGHRPDELIAEMSAALDAAQN